MRNLVHIKDYLEHKKKNASTRKRKTLVCLENGRSTDFIIPSFATGCEIFCQYCYVSRNRPYGNPLELYTNDDEIWNSIRDHYLTLGNKVPNQCDPVYWTYDIGESTDCGTPKVIGTTKYFINKFLSETNAKPSFATKLDVSNKFDALPEEFKNRVRIRTSLMPQHVSTIVEPVTSPIINRILSIDKLVGKGYEVHINFSPVIITDTWEQDYIDLFKLVDSNLSDESKKQVKCEVIFLTHSESLHEAQKDKVPEVDKLLYNPKLQETKTNLRGSQVLRYRHASVKKDAIEKFKELVRTYVPYCKIRYIF